MTKRQKCSTLKFNIYHKLQMKECTKLTCNRPSESWEKAKKSKLEKMAKGRERRERGRKILLISPSYSLLRLFCSIPHFVPLSTIHCPLRLEQASLRWAREFFPIPMQGSIDVHLGAFDILKAHSHAATVPALACVKRHFSVLL